MPPSDCIVIGCCLFVNTAVYVSSFLTTKVYSAFVLTVFPAESIHFVKSYLKVGVAIIVIFVPPIVSTLSIDTVPLPVSSLSKYKTHGLPAVGSGSTLSFIPSPS